MLRDVVDSYKCEGETHRLIRQSETLVTTYKNTRSRIPEGHSRHVRENVRSLMFYTLLNI